jgi:hypothetical protein
VPQYYVTVHCLSWVNNTEITVEIKEYFDSDLQNLCTVCSAETYAEVALRWTDTRWPLTVQRRAATC